MKHHLNALLAATLLLSGAAATAPLDDLLQRYCKYDLDGDGTAEIERLKPMDFEKTEGVTGGLPLLVLVEERLLAHIPKSKLTATDLRARLQQFSRDLTREGWSPRFVLARVYSGPEHQDGRTLLALRRLLIDVRAAQPGFAGVVLVGSFPEALLVRRWIWHRRALHNMKIGAVKVASRTPYLRMVPEIIAERAELVLADLDGQWEAVYRRGPVSLASLGLLPQEGWPEEWPSEGGSYSSPHFNHTHRKLEDIFWIEDDRWTVTKAGQTLTATTFPALRHPELADVDRGSNNPIARPEIIVSRINARHIAVSPRPGFVDQSGRPQTMSADQKLSLKIEHFWRRDPALERRILVDYFDRNHRFRTGRSRGHRFRAAAVTYGSRGEFSAASLAKYLAATSPAFEAPVVKNNANILEYVRWLRAPAVLRGIMAHSSPWNSAFSGKYSVEALEAETGPPWRWALAENEKAPKDTVRHTYVPTFRQQRGHADLYLHRTLWENGVLGNAGASLYIHPGCQLNSPNGASTLPYSHAHYGSWQTAEGVLFFLNGLAVVSRAKVFYDWPRGFPSELAKPGAVLGSGWVRYFQEEANDAKLAARVASCKRSYTWSVIGDWTLRLKYEPRSGDATSAR